MPAFAADQELDRLAAEREAWDAYLATLLGLEGPEYESAEVQAWERLQDRLAETSR
ncbi:hypothetical protein [Capillimicrobium parvum]|uniref:Uncharacterized protein n=1 Tax=Capillimicrobium parvum TaxID=2884022 RepID=A0A9E7BZL7_9ACTN|nr:hypothetical protein [Capillimicrobium parvum]UGS35461.1 hypothetical protein DSM104329_01849 [Capillimicrobium parvum]